MNDRWSLDALYKGYDDPAFDADVKRMKALCTEFDSFSKTLPSAEPKTALVYALTLQEQLTAVAVRLITFTGLQLAVDARDEQSTAWNGKLQTDLSDTAGAGARFRKYIASLPDLDGLIASDPLLTEYGYLLRNIREDSRYLLSEEAETVIAKLNISGGSAWGDLQNYLTSTVQAEYQGGKLGLAAVRNLAYDADPKVRRDGYEAELACYEKIRDGLSFSLNSIKQEVITETKLRGYGSPLARTLLESRMKKETLDALLAAIEEFLPKFRAYLRAKGRALGHENGLPWYDLFAPMGRYDRKYTPEQARDELLSLFDTFDTELKEVMARAFDERWIDFFPRDGKAGGAFCCGIHPIGQFRILTNFDGTFSSVATLAHELGHGFHDQCVFTAHRILNGEYSMPVAETASIFNEQVLAAAALKRASDAQERLALLENKIQDACQIICDIYSRYRFETELFSRRENEFMFPDTLCQMMLAAQDEAYGDGLDPVLRHPYMWACKGHYYSTGLSFYNFPYAFGGLFARGLYAKYMAEGAPFVPKYKALLRATTVNTVEDTAAMADINLADIDFWRSGLQSIADEIDEYIALLK